MLPYLSVIIPCYNEKKTIEILIDKVLSVKKIKKEIILVDDNSNDGTRELIKKKLATKVNKIIFHKKNMGKGSCIKSAQKYVNGNIVVIQDADLEYDPNDYHKLIKPILNNRCKIVYGSRVLNKNIFEDLKNFSHWVRVMGNYFLTKFSNFLNKQNLTDAHTCYKVFDTGVFKKIKLVENDFAFCPEVTTKISNLGYKIYEVPINYKGRPYSEGKKIKFKDGIKAIFTLIKYKFFLR